MSDPFNISGFTDSVAASALFFSSDHTKALRVEAPDIALEFTDNAYIGTDPEGILYFYGTNDFKGADASGTDVKHTYTIKSVVNSGTTYATIEFVRGTDTSPYAKFVAKDPKKVVTTAGLDNYSSTGKWNALLIGSSSAVVEKTSTNSTVTITASVIGKVGTWDSAGSDLDHKTFAVPGILHFKLLTDINKKGNSTDSPYANCNNDRIVFYTSDNFAKDFTSYFIPLENSKEEFGLPNGKVFSKVQWN